MKTTIELTSGERMVARVLLKKVREELEYSKKHKVFTESLDRKQMFALSRLTVQFLDNVIDKL